MFIEHLNLEKIVLVTWSSGSPISSLVAMNRPDLVAGVVLYEPNTLDIDDESDSDYPSAGKQRFLGTFKRIFKHLEDGDPESATKAFLETVFENTASEFETELMAIQRVVLDNVKTVPLHFSSNSPEDVKFTCNDLAKIDVPVLVLFGEQTNEYWQYRARRYSECATHAAISEIEGVNHAGPIRVPDKIFSHINQFVDSVLDTN